VNVRSKKPLQPHSSFVFEVNFRDDCHNPHNHTLSSFLVVDPQALRVIIIITKDNNKGSVKRWGCNQEEGLVLAGWEGLFVVVNMYHRKIMTYKITPEKPLHPHTPSASKENSSANCHKKATTNPTINQEEEELDNKNKEKNSGKSGSVRETIAVLKKEVWLSQLLLRNSYIL